MIFKLCSATFSTLIKKNSYLIISVEQKKNIFSSVSLSTCVYFKKLAVILATNYFDPCKVQRLNGNLIVN